MQLMSIEDLAAYLGDSKRTIYKYIASGDCPPYIRISAKNIKFDRGDVDAWLESKKVHPEPGGKEVSDISFLYRTKAALRNAAQWGKLPWTARAQAVFGCSQKQAQENGFALVGTEHILFGIVSVKDCLGAVILENLGLIPSEFHQRYRQLYKTTNERSTGKAKLSEDIDKVIKCAYEQATRWGHKYIGAEHLLVGLLLAGTGLGFQILTDLGITLEKVCEETKKLTICRDISDERNKK